MMEPERSLPEFQEWVRSPSEIEGSDLVRDKPRAAAFALDFICWLHDEANQVLSIGPTSLPASTTCPSQPSPAPEIIVEPKQRKKSGGGGRAVKALFGDDDFPALGPSGAAASSSAAFANAPISAPVSAPAFGNASSAFASPEKGGMMRPGGAWGQKAGQQAVATGLRPSPHAAKAQKDQKAKRRIRPTLLNETSLADGSGGHGDLTRVQSEAPIERSDRSAVATAVVGAVESPFKTPVKGAAASPFTRPLSAGPSTEKKKKRGLPTAPPPLLLCSPPSRKPSISLSILTAPPPDSERLGTVARAYAVLLRERLVPKLSREIHLLLRMIIVDEGACVPPKCPNLDALSIDEEPKAQDTVDMAPPAPLLCTGLACHIFANVVLEQLRPLLLSLGPCLLTRLSSRLPIALSLPPSVSSGPPAPCQNLPLIVEEAKKEAEQAWDRAAEKAAALLGQQQAIATMGRDSSADGGSGYALPFQQDRDARHAYQGCPWSRDLYNRQESTRDAFLQLLRDFQAEKSQLDNHRVSRFLDTLPQRSARVLDLLQPGPAAASSLSCASTWGASSAAMAWFARFFTDTLVQMGLTAAQETDEDVLRTLKSRGGSWNAQKVQQLQGRLRTRSQPANPGANSNRQRGPSRADLGAGEPQRKRGGSGGVQRQTSTSSTSSNAAGPSVRIPSPEDSFTGNQEFFFRFLRACNNHALNTILAQHLAACLSQSVMAGEEERVDDLITRTARLKIVARFLGVLAFGPYWMPPEALQAYERVEVLQRQLHDTIRNLDLQLAPCPSGSSPSPLPALPLLDKAWLDGRAVLTLPWLTSFLSMMRWDLASPRTRTYTALFSRLRAMLQHLYAALLTAAQAGQEGAATATDGPSPSPPSSPACAWSTALYLILEVEQLFDELGVDPAGPCDDTGLAPFGRGLDGTPLLLSEAFVSRCCPPLSDLLHLVSASPSSLTSLRSRSGSVTSATGDVSSSTPIKKVRPYTISTSITARIQPTTLPTTLATSSGSRAPSQQLLQRLESCFFSQHPHVHRSAELVLQASLRNARALALSACCDPMASKTLADLFPSTSSLPVEDPSILADKLALAEEGLAAETRGFLKRLYPERIPAALELLVRPAADPAVAQMAGSLTVQHALKDGIEPVVREVCEAFRKRIDSHRHALLRKARAKLSTHPIPAAAEGGGAMASGGAAGDLFKVKEEMAVVANSAQPCGQMITGLLYRAAAAMRALAGGEDELDSNVVMYACTDFGLDACRAKKQLGDARPSSDNPPAAAETEQEAGEKESGAAWVGFWEALAALACHLATALVGGQHDEWAKEKVAMPLRRLIREEGAVESLFYSLRGRHRRDEGGLDFSSFQQWWLGLLKAGVVTPLQIEDALVRLLQYGDCDRMDACREVIVAFRSQITDSVEGQPGETSEIVPFCHLDALLEIMQ